MRYEHTQRSPWTVAIAAGLVVLCIVSVFAGWADTLGGVWWFVLIGVVAVVLAVASQLTVQVDDEAVTASFGPGWPRRRVALAAIAGVESRRVRWYHGWGIRKVRGGTMFNTSGFDAVELRLRGGGVFWIGTDEPTELSAAIVDAAGLSVSDNA